MVEINSQAEADFMREISHEFLIGAKKDMNTGLWHWETTGEVIDSTKFLMLSPGTEPKHHRATMTKENHIKKLHLNAFDSEDPTNDYYRLSSSDVICETPSKFIDSNPLSMFSPPKIKWKATLQSSDNVTYHFSAYKLPWKSAERHCRENGGWLAEPRTKKQNDALAALFKKTGEWTESSIWLGARLEGEQSRG